MRYYYDLHIHSCLSPCGDNDMTPDSIAGMGELNKLDIMALTDHNTLKNCPAFFKAAYRHGIIPVAGTELTTAEDIHTVCLFATLPGAMEFEKVLEERRIKIKNRPDIFGEQRITDENDNITGYDDYLLINATSFSLEEVPQAVEKYGVCKGGWLALRRTYRQAVKRLACSARVLPRKTVLSVCRGARRGKGGRICRKIRQKNHNKLRRSLFMGYKRARRLHRA